MTYVRLLLTGALALLCLPSTALAAGPPRTVAEADATLAVPPGWQVAIPATTRCDPKMLIVLSSARLHVGARSDVFRPRDGGVVVMLLEDRLPVDRPFGDLRRPRRFAVRWNHLTRLKSGSVCGLPDAPASMHYFEERGRYLGFIVYPGRRSSRRAESEALTVMNSLRVQG